MGSIVPGGAATAGAVAYKMLVKAGMRSDDVAAGLAASAIASTAAVCAMPVLALPGILGGAAAPDGLLQAATSEWRHSSQSPCSRQPRSAGTSHC